MRICPLIFAFLLALLWSGCQPTPPTEPSEGSAEAGAEATDETTEETASALGPETAGSAEEQRPEPARSAPLEIEGSRPDELLPLLPATADLVLLIDGDAVRVVLTEGPANFLGRDDTEVGQALGQTVLATAFPTLSEAAAERLDLLEAGAWALAWDTDGESIDAVLALPVEAFRSPPAEGAPARIGELVAARQGDWIVLGHPRLVLGLQEGRLGGFDPLAALPTPWSASSTEAVFTAIVPSLEQAPEIIRESLSWMESAGTRGFIFGVTGDGAVELLMDLDDPESLSEELGRGQMFTSTALGQLRGTASSAWQPLVSWGSRATLGMWSRLELEQVGDATRLRLPPPSCGGAWSNAFNAAFVLGATVASARDDAIRPAPLSRTTEVLSSVCDPISGPPPSLPTSLAAMAPRDFDVPAAVVLFDHAALLRHSLPTGFGLLPFAIDADALIESIGPSPMGLNGLDDAEGSGGFYAGIAERGLGMDQTLIVHPGFARIPGGSEDIGPMSSSPSSFGAMYTTSASTMIRRLEVRDTSHPWVELANQFADDTTWAVMVSAGALAPALRRISTRSTLTAVIEDGGVLGISSSVRYGPVLTFFGATDASVVRDELGGFLVELVRVNQSAAPLPEAVEERLREAIGSLLETADFTVVGGNRVEVTFGPYPGARFASVLATTAFPLLGGAIERGGLMDAGLVPAPMLQPLVLDPAALGQ